jgi:hypothetical protein
MNAILAGFLAGALPLLLETGRNVEFEYATLSAWCASILCFFIRDTNYFKATLSMVASALIPMTFWLTFSPKLCSVASSYAWFFIQVPPAIFIFLSLRNFLSKSPLKRSLLILGLMLLSIYVFMWSNPQKRWVSLWFGYLHGPVYDDFIPLTFGVITARFSHFLFGIFLYFPNRSLGLLSLITWGISMYDPINSHGHHALKTYLSDSLIADEITLHFKGENKTDAPSLLKEATFHKEQISSILALKDIPKIDIYVYSSTDEKKIYFGGGETDITDVFSPSIHIVASPSPHPTLRHELVHALLSQQNSLGFHWNMLITEGIAVALAPSDSPVTLNEQARYLIEKGELPKLTEVFGPLFWLKSASITYGIAGSFIRWLLIEKNGESFLKVYGGASFEDSYQTSLEKLYQSWINYIKTIPYDPIRVNSLISRLLEEPGVFFDVCPHAKIDRMAVSPQSLLNSSNSNDYLKWLSKVHPESRVLRNDKFDKARKQPVTPESVDSPSELTSIGDFEQMLLKVDLLALNDRFSESSNLLTRLESTPINPGRALKRAVELRRYTLEELSGSEVKSTFQFLVGTSTDSTLDNSVTRYLKRKNENTLKSLDLFSVKFVELNREILKLNYLLFEKEKKFDEAKGFLKILNANEPKNDYLKLEFERLEHYSR